MSRSHSFCTDCGALRRRLSNALRSPLLNCSVADGRPTLGPDFAAVGVIRCVIGGLLGCAFGVVGADANGGVTGVADGSTASAT